MKNQKGISLIALIITIIVIIILAAIAIGGIFNTPRDARFAQFCSDFDTLQTASQLKYYELYADDQMDASDSYYMTAAELVVQVATGAAPTRTANDTPYVPEAWVAFTDAGFEELGIKKPTYSTASNDWALHTTSDDEDPLCRLVYIPGFEKDEDEWFKNPTDVVAGLNGTRETGATTLGLELDGE